MPRLERRRASKPKVRTGCKTCKIRHVKCDERKPECERCQKSGFDCDGYPDTSTEFAERAILPKCGQAFEYWMTDLEPNNGSVFKIPWGSMFQTESEYRYFKFFQSKTANHLSGYFDTDLWGRLILQACEDEEFARHGVLALSALHKTIETISSRDSLLDSSENVCQTANNHHEVALQHYAKSLQLMQQRTADANDEHHLRNLLVSCLLTVCFENYHGNEELALAQAVSGIRLLSQFQEQLSSNAIPMQATSSNSGLSTIDPDLINAFTRLEIVVIHVMESIPEQRHSSMHIRRANNTLGTMPPNFFSLKEARYYWDIMVRRTIHGYHDKSEDPLPAWQMYVHEEELPSDTETSPPPEGTFLRLKQEHVEIGERWFMSFEPLFMRLRDKPEDNDFCGAMVLKIHFIVARLAHPSTPDAQAIKDSAELLQLAKSVLSPSQSSPQIPTYHRPVFSFDGNLVAPIFRVATRCRIRNLRRDAIALLKMYPRREGFWDSEMAARVAEWFVDTEEEGLGPDEEIDPDERLIMVSNNFDLSERKTVVQCARRVKGQPTEVLPSVLLRW